MTALKPVPTPFANDDSPVNLRELIRDAAKAFPGASWKLIASMVAANVPEDQLRAALEQALAPMVREVVTEHRPRGPVARPFDSPPAASPSKPSPQPPTQNIGGPSPMRSGSRKGSEIRDAWQRVLDAPYATEQGHKRLGDCTYDDLQFVAAQLDRQAEQHKARARGFRELAALMTDHEVKNLRDLPAEVLMQALGAK